MNNVKKIILIVLVAVVFGLLMGYRSDLPFGWSRAIVAAPAFVVLGWLVTTPHAYRRELLRFRTEAV